MIKLEAIQLQRLTATTLQRLNVTDTVSVREIRELPDGTWLLGFDDRLPNTRFPGFEVYIEQDWSIEDAGRELRWELRKKLWICPLCQRRGEIRRMVDREIFRVECEQCGRYEIEGDLLEHLRQAVEEDSPVVIERLARLAQYVRGADRLPPLSMGNWEDLAESR